MKLREYKNQLIEVLDAALDDTDKARVEEELSIVERAEGYLMNTRSEEQFVEASRREVQEIFDKILF